jgi:hypothetical protein
MKATILCIFMLLILNTSSAQTIADSVIVQKYLSKSKRQKTGAWFCLIGGSAMGVLGLAKMKELENDPSVGLTEAINSGVGWSVLTLTGASLVIGSIPLFINSKKNAHTAASVSLTNQRLQIPSRFRSVAHLQSLTLTIEL